MKHTFKRTISFLLALALLFTLAPRLSGPAAASEGLNEVVGPDDEVLEEIEYDGTRLGISLMLYHMAGEPETDLSVLDQFTDLEDCTEAERAAIAWAYGNGITSSMTSNTFSPYSSITKAQAVSYIWKAKGAPEPTTTESPFVDIPKPSNWAYRPILWATENTDWLECYEQDSNYFEPHRVVNQMILYKCLTDSTMLWKLSIIPVPYPTSGSCGDNLTWSFDSETGVLTIEGTGAMWDAESYFWRNFSSNIRAVSLPDGLSSIGSHAFYRCTGLSSVSIPEGVTAIGGYAFCDCTGLSSVSIPESVTSIDSYTFSGCTGLSSILIPDAVSSIGDYAFSGCTGLRSITVPKSLEIVQQATFSGCSALAELIVRNPACLACSYIEGAEVNDSGEDLYEMSYPETLGNSDRTIIYGKHDATLENSAPVRLFYTSWVDGSWEAADYRYIENYAKTYGYTFYATNVFSDVGEGKWYEIPVAWAYGKGITGGVGEGRFGPNKQCTREQVMVFLWAANGSPEPESTVNPFKDVKKKDYFYKAVLWAVENGITGGVDDTHFGTGKVCDRAQVVTFLWAAAGSPEPETAENPFTDVKRKDYFYKAVLWAVENGVTGGTTPSTFSPRKECTRAQVVTFLYAAYGN